MLMGTIITSMMKHWDTSREYCS